MKPTLSNMRQTGLDTPIVLTYMIIRRFAAFSETIETAKKLLKNTTNPSESKTLHRRLASSYMSRAARKIKTI